MNRQENIPTADFSFVRYANCWEDPLLLIPVLNAKAGRRILSIASAGDNALSLLASGAEVIAADLNPAQLACTELRKEAMRMMEQPDFLRFCGISDDANRIASYNTIRQNLSDPARTYWDNHTQDIQSGFIHSGKFEHYFHLFRTRILPLIHRQSTIERLLEQKSLNQRKEFYEKTWNNVRWKMLFRLFFSRRIMGRHGRDPEFFRHVEGRVSERILERTKHALTELDTADNPYLHYILKGNFGRALPHYLQPDSYSSIRSNLDNLIIRHGAIDEIAAEQGPGSFDGYNLSDIFEYLSTEQCEQVYGRLLASARPGARLAYWNMLVPRLCPASLADQVISLDCEADHLLLQDRAFFYSRYVVEEVR